MKFILLLLITRSSLQTLAAAGGGSTSDAEQKLANSELNERNIAMAKGAENVIKLFGFDNLDVRYTGKEKEDQREVIDNDTPLMILPPKPIIIMPQFIVPKTRAAKFRMVNQFFI